MQLSLKLCGEIMKEYMKEYIRKAGDGFFCYEQPEVEISEYSIDISIDCNARYSNTITIKSKDDFIIHGFVRSSNPRMHTPVKEFEGTHIDIPYEFTSDGLNEGDVVSGRVYIITNAMEYTVYYQVTIKNEFLTSSMGEIRNLFHYTNLAKTSWDEAIDLFYHQDFYKIFTNYDKQFLMDYQAIRNIPKSESNVDEFLTAINKKKEVTFTIQQDHFNLVDIEDSVMEEILIEKTGWGFLDIKIESDGEFVSIEKNSISHRDFIGNTYRLQFLILSDHLHVGKNLGFIKLTSRNNSRTITIMARKKNESGKRDKKAEWEKRKIKDILNLYIDKQMKRIPSADYLENSMQIADKLAAIKELQPFFLLYKIHLFISDNQVEEANKLMELYTSRQTADNNILNAYKSFLLYLTETDRNRKISLAEEIRQIYVQNRENTFLALLYVKTCENRESDTKKLEILEQLYYDGNKSALLLLEAYLFFSENPTTLLKMNAFEIAVLNFAVKRKKMEPEIARQTAYISARKKDYNPLFLKLLKNIYELTLDMDMLSTICGYMIKQNLYDASCFKWYELGAIQELRITRLFEYFMYSVGDSYAKLLPQNVLLYFVYNSNLDYRKNAYLYANMIRYGYDKPELLRSHEKHIEKLMYEQIGQEHINEDLAVIYNAYIKSNLLTKELGEHLANIMFTHVVYCNDRNIHRVIIIHRQLSGERVYTLTNGMAYVAIYSNEYHIIFEDVNHIRYLQNVNYEIKPLLQKEGLLKYLSKYVEGNLGLSLYVCQNSIHIGDIDNEAAASYQTVLESVEVTEEYKTEIRQDILNFWYNEDKFEQLDQYLVHIEYSKLHNQDRAKIIELMVIRELYDNAYALIRQFGFEGISPKSMLKLISQFILLKEDEKDGYLVQAAYYTFQNGKYNQTILSYLLKYYEGPLKNLKKLWIAAKEFDVDHYELSERIIMQIILTKGYVANEEDIFEEYCRQTSNVEIEIAFLSFYAYDYFIKQSIRNDKLFAYIIRNYLNNENLNEICKLALLKYFHGIRSKLTVEDYKIINAMISEFVDKKIYFPFFLDFKEHVEALDLLKDMIIIEYRTNPRHQVTIHYLMDGETDSPYKEEKMRKLYEGIYIKEFLLFFGENLQYYITEEEKGTGNIQITESNQIRRNDISLYHNQNKFDLINDMLVSKILNEEQTLPEMMDNFLKKQYLVEGLFSMKE